MNIKEENYFPLLNVSTQGDASVVVSINAREFFKSGHSALDSRLHNVHFRLNFSVLYVLVILNKAFKNNIVTKLYFESICILKYELNCKL